MASSEAHEEKSSGEGSPGEDKGEGEEEVKEGGAAEDVAGEGEEEREEAAGRGGKDGEGKKKRGRRPKKAKEEGVEKKVKVSKKRAAREGKPTTERPSRERKTVERFSEMSPRRAAVPKAVSIQQGSGTKLKDIPNVFFKISKRKVDESLQFLHTLLFAKRAKALYLKRNLYQFSGFVWTENEDKQRAKVKEKLDKCVKGKLLDLCDVLDIAVVKTTTKKEDISAKLLEFLESPYVTRDIVLAEKEQSRRGRKRKKRGSGVSESTPGYVDSDRETKKPKGNESSAVKKRYKYSAKTIVDNEGEDGAADSEGASDEDQDAGGKAEEKHDEKSESDSDGDVQAVPVADKNVKKQTSKGAKSKVNIESSTVKKGSPAKSAKIPSRSPPKKSSSEGRAKASPKDSTGSSLELSKRGRKALTKQKSESTKSKEDINKSQSNKESLTGKDKKKAHSVSASEHALTKGKGKGRSSGIEEPTKEEIHAVVRDILRVVDFNTATLADILKQLGSHFSVDLMHRKAEVKGIIEEVINDMTDDEEEESEEDDAEGQE